MKAAALCWFIFFINLYADAQELYVYTKPASNEPGNSLFIHTKLHHSPKDIVFDRPAQRWNIDIGTGVSKNLMLSIGTSFSNMHTYAFEHESFSFYSKYRFLSNDDVKSHFRVAAFVKASYTKAPFHFDEVTLDGDKTGVQTGIIATKLRNRLAISSSVAHTQLLDRSRFNKVFYSPRRLYQVMDYTLSAGYLLLPKQYKSFSQPNLNLYCEVLAQQALDKPVYFIDIAPSVQLIIASSFKINAGCRMQLAGTAERMSRFTALLSLEKSFLGFFKKKVN